MSAALLGLLAFTQVLYLISSLCEIYLRTRPIDWVRLGRNARESARPYARIVLLYPVLREPEETMRTTMSALAQVDYPQDKYRVVALPNFNDHASVEILHRMQRDYPFLEVVVVPPTSDPSWEPVWKAWDENENAYWWHRTARAHVRDLPPKKTRQLIYAFYTLLEAEGDGDWLLNYIDADSVPPRDHFLAGSIGMQKFDVLQSTNVAGNLLSSWAASLHASDHMAWDGSRYPHLSANGKHPYWVLGEGLFFRASDLAEIGGFNPWITIEDPEVGMRLWANGKRLGIITSPLIEEVPATLRRGIIQRKRWVCGFLQSLNSPLKQMGMTFSQRLRARMNFWPCMFLLVNPIGLPVGAWAFVNAADGALPWWVLPLGIVNVTAFTLSMGLTYQSAWTQTARVLDS